MGTMFLFRKKDLLEAVKNINKKMIDDCNEFVVNNKAKRNKKSGYSILLEITNT